MSQLIDGKKLAEKILVELRTEVIKLDPPPGLAIILIGSDPASHLYVSLKQKACHEIGIDFHKYLFNENAKENEILETIDFLNKDESVNAILIQLPLPAQFDQQKLINAIDPAKDVDGFHPENLDRIKAADISALPPLTLSVLELINETKQDINGKTALIIGNSDIFAIPLQQTLIQQGVKTDYIAPSDDNLISLAQIADILIVAVGKPNFITKKMVKKNSIIIDVGTNKTGQGTIGDIDPAVDEICAYRSPVPGGVGPVTVAMLLKNTINLYRRQNNI